MLLKTYHMYLGCGKDPYASDPCFESVEAMKKCLREMGHRDVVITNENAEVERDADIEDRICTFQKCTGLKIR